MQTDDLRQNHAEHDPFESRVVAEQLLDLRVLLCDVEESVNCYYERK